MAAVPELQPDPATAQDVYEDCPGCHSARVTDKWIIHGYTISACAECHLVFVKQRVAAAALEKYYNAVHDEVYDDDNSACLRFYYNALKREIDRRTLHKGRILDVGCAGGWFLDTMQGWECQGCEISLRDYEIARKKHGESIRNCSFEEFSAPLGSFDVIAMQDVFDHLPEPAAALQKCRELLRPGGLMIIKVHDISCLYAKVTGQNFYALIPPSHLFYYSRRSLTAMLHGAGFEVIGSRHIGHILKLKTVFNRLSRGDHNSIHYRIFRTLNSSPIGNFKLYKNLHDIITVFATVAKG